MSSVGINITILDLVLMALAAGSPGFLIGLVAGALLRPRGRIVGALLGGVLGFFICLGGVLVWVLLRR